MSRPSIVQRIRNIIYSLWQIIIIIHKEITDWSDAGCNVKNHTYIFNDKNENVGYIITGTKEEIFYKKIQNFFQRREDNL